MNTHKNARTTPYLRAFFVQRLNAGVTPQELASSCGVSVRTVYNRHVSPSCGIRCWHARVKLSCQRFPLPPSWHTSDRLEDATLYAHSHCLRRQQQRR